MNKNIMKYISRKHIILLAVLGSISNYVLAQDDLFGKKTETKLPAHHGWLVGLNGNLDIPGGDMAKRFGVSYRIGPSVLYKTTSNWLFGVKGDFILGNQVTEDSLMANIKDHTGNMLNQDGSRLSPNLYERGYMVGLQAGRIFNTSKKMADNGIMVLGTVGFMQHKILISSSGNTIPEIRGDYKKGYDRLANGMFIEGYVGYAYFGKDGLLNFNIGLDVTAGFTQGRRDYLYDVMRPDNKSRTDIFFGLRASWYIPMFKRKSEEYIFE